MIWLVLSYELRPLYVALGWALFGLVLFETGLMRKSFSWRLQVYVAFATSFVQIFSVNIDARHGELLVSTLPLAAVFHYAYWRPEGGTHNFLELDVRMRAGSLFSYLGSATLVMILRVWLFWLSRSWLGPACIDLDWCGMGHEARCLSAPEVSAVWRAFLFRYFFQSSGREQMGKHVAR